MKVFGIDPGTEKAGFGVVQIDGSRCRLLDHGVVKVSRRLPFATRLLKIHEGLRCALDDHRPEVVVIEQVFHGKNARTALKIGEGRGVALLTAAQTGSRVVEYAARDVKKAVVGNGGAQKAQVQWMIAQTFGLDREALAEDAADALALCITHGHQLAIDALLR